MAKVTGPLLSATASGSIGPRLTYSKKASGAQVRIQRAQKDYENPARKVVRDAYRTGLILWNSLPTIEKNYWNEIEQKGFVDV